MSIPNPEYHVNQVVDLVVPNGKMKGSYSTHIAVMNEASLLLKAPQVGNLFLPVQPGDKLKLSYVSDAWSYESDVEVNARKDDRNPPLILLPRPKSAVKKQMREYVRVEVDIETNVRLLSDIAEFETELPEGEELISCTMVDVSGGACRIRMPRGIDTTNKPYAVLWFTLPYVHKSYYNVLTHIINSNVTDTYKDVILKFTGLSDGDRNDLVQFCYRAQVRRRHEKDVKE